MEKEQRKIFKVFCCPSFPLLIPEKLAGSKEMQKAKHITFTLPFFFPHIPEEWLNWKNKYRRITEFSGLCFESAVCLP